MNRPFAIVVAALVLLACDAQKVSDPVSPDGTGATANRSAADESHNGTPGITALTWNVYVGAEVERVLQAQTPDQAVAIATQQWANVRATNFPARAGSIAASIAAQRPELVGLEEVALYRTTDRPFEELATHVAYDFLQLVIDSLKARGLDYKAAAVDRTTDIQVPVIAGFDASGAPILAGVRYTDGDAVLVRGDIHYANPQSAVYAAHQSVSIGGVTTGVYQGWSSVEALVDGQAHRFVVTHLAGQEVQSTQLAQTAELVALLRSESRPTILAGDFNSDAYGADPTRATPTYPTLRAAGYSDSWIERGRRAPGLTCCEQPDLLNPRPTFNQRIDFIFTRNLAASTRVVRREVVGDRLVDRRTGLWPSDHAGVVATLLTPSAEQAREDGQ
jgi:endonuclease/exonuclease/phosphatase family protein